MSDRIEYQDPAIGTTGEVMESDEMANLRTAGWDTINFLDGLARQIASLLPAKAAECEFASDRLERAVMDAFGGAGATGSTPTATDAASRIKTNNMCPTIKCCLIICEKM